MESIKTFTTGVGKAAVDLFESRDVRMKGVARTPAGLSTLLRPRDVARYKNVVSWALNQEKQGGLFRGVGPRDPFEDALTWYRSFGTRDDSHSIWIGSVHRLSPVLFKKYMPRPDYYNMPIHELEQLRKNCKAQVKFYHRLVASLPHGSLENLPPFNVIAEEYGHFLWQLVELKQSPGGAKKSLAPTLHQDFAWHAHMLSPSYLDDVYFALGFELDHEIHTEADLAGKEDTLVRAKPFRDWNTIPSLPSACSTSGCSATIMPMPNPNGGGFSVSTDAVDLAVQLTSQMHSDSDPSLQTLDLNVLSCSTSGCASCASCSA